MRLGTYTPQDHCPRSSLAWLDGMVILLSIGGDRSRSGPAILGPFHDLSIRHHGTWRGPWSVKA